MLHILDQAVQNAYSGKRLWRIGLSFLLSFPLTREWII